MDELKKEIEQLKRERDEARECCQHLADLFQEKFEHANDEIAALVSGEQWKPQIKQEKAQ